MIFSKIWMMILIFIHLTIFTALSSERISIFISIPDKSVVIGGDCHSLEWPRKDGFTGQHVPIEEAIKATNENFLSKLRIKQLKNKCDGICSYKIKISSDVNYYYVTRCYDYFKWKL